MATPNKVDDYVPYRLLLFVETSLAAISAAAGYNCDVFVTDDFDAFENSTAKHRLYFQATTLDPVLQGVGGTEGPAGNYAATYNVFGVSRYETEHPRRLNFALEQDVRTALNSEVSSLRAAVGRGGSFRFGSTEYDAGALAPVKEAGFDMSVSLTWSQKSDW